MTLTRTITFICLLAFCACEDKVGIQANGKPTDFSLKITPHDTRLKSITYTLKKVVPMVTAGNNNISNFILRGTDNTGAEITFSGHVGEVRFFHLNLVIKTKSGEQYYRECDSGSFSNTSTTGSDSGGKFVEITGTICLSDRKDGVVGPTNGVNLDLVPFKLYYHKP